MSREIIYYYLIFSVLSCPETGLKHTILKLLLNDHLPLLNNGKRYSIYLFLNKKICKCRNFKK